MRPAFTFCFLIFTFCFFSANAQHFQWVRGGGTAQNTPSGYMNEATKFMTTDANGNAYALSIVGDDPITADTFHAGGAYGAPNNILVTSYTRTGQMRWAKLIASTTSSCVPFGIAADSIGHVYVAGFMPTNGGTLHLGYDTILTGTANEYLYDGLIQYDTSGHFNWIKYAGNNTISSLMGASSIGSLIIDGNNDAHTVLYMGSGVVLLVGDTSHAGEYDLSYNTAGSLLSAVRLDMDSVWYVTGAAIDAVSGKLYVCGERNQAIVPTYCTYVAAFDAVRNVICMDTVGNNTMGFTDVIYDKTGHLYFSAGSQGAFTFNGYSVPGENKSIIIKTDTIENPIWIDAAFITTSASGISQITLLPNNLITGAGIVAGTLTDGSHTIITPADEGQNPYITVLDTSGAVMSLQQLHGDGFYDWATSITSDRIGNVYIGGQVADSIYAGSIPAYYSVGGNTDFFVMRYGIDSDCLAMPIADYTVTGMDTAHTRNFTYTGIAPADLGGATPIDSMVWNFGDGSAVVNGTGPINHTYDTGAYEACVTVYSRCGNDMHCSRIEIVPPTEISPVLSEGEVEVYPNPATDELIIETSPILSEGEVTVFDIVGKKVLSGSIKNAKQAIDVGGLSNGSYLLQITKNDGSRFVQKFVIAR